MQELIGSILFGLIMVILGVIALALAFWYIKNELKYRDKIFILKEDGAGNLNFRQGRAGVFIDKKTGNKRFFLKKEYVGLNPDKIPYIPCSKGMFGSGNGCFLLQVGLKNFRFLSPKMAAGLFKFEVGEEDVNWGINSYERQKNLFQNSFWDKIMPYIPLIIVGFMMLAMFVYIFKQVPNFIVILEQLKEITANMAKSQLSGTVVN